MSEETLIQKKKKKIEFDYTKAVAILKPLVKKWSELDEEVAKKLHEYYLIPDCRLNVLCEYLGISDQTVYNMFDKYNLPRKFEAKSEAALNRDISPNNLENEQLEPAQVEDEQETEYDTIKYQETYGILKNAQRLSKNMFQVIEKDDLIKELQVTIKKLTTLLLKLESNIEE
jgi:hypothetical protein